MVAIQNITGGDGSGSGSRVPMIRLSRGERYPLPLPAGDGMVAILTPVDDPGLSLTLLVALTAMRPREARALRRDPVELTLVTTPHAALIGLRAGRLEMDAPYALAREASADREALRAGASRMRAIAPPARWLVEIHAVDRDTAIVRGLRAVTVSAVWAATFATGLLRQGDDAALAEREIGALYHRLPNHAALIAAAEIIEFGARA